MTGWSPEVMLAAANGWGPILDVVAQQIVDMGYTGRVTLVVQASETGGLGGRRVLVLDLEKQDGRIVGGREIFEVVTTVEQVDCTFTFTHTPKLLDWPSMLPSTPPTEHDA